ncbi:MAG: hypothetical protein SFU56_12945 [Capsulimonadales bacterium]|nr:hypothetical protein [Capsulimonadales bacterium]
MPYFLLSDDERTAYRDRGFDLLETAMKGNLFGWFGGTSVRGLCDMIGEATIEPHDFVPTDAEWEAAFSNFFQKHTLREG